LKSLEEDKVRDIRVVKDYHGERVEVLGDDVQLQQAFINVIRNAIEAMDYQGTLSIRVGIYNVFWAQAEIVDTGAGMSKEVRAQAFEPFFTTKRRGRGTGLGLPITRRIIDDHRGNIDVITEGRGGTTVLIQLPLSS
jgi:signal transduction histidine kinase